MNKRVRLTSRKAADGSIPYPGNVNQPGRTDPAWDQYHTFEQQINHELPDMRTEWKDDSRDDIGFGVPEANPPTVASVRVAANKAVRIAVLLLGEKVSDGVIEAQARDLMALNGEAMDRTLDRFAQTQKLYAEDAEEEKPTEEKKASAELADKGGVPPAISLKETEIKSEDKKEEDKPAEVKAEDKKEEDKPAEVKAEDKKPMPDFIKEKIEEKKEKEDKKAADEEKKEDKVEARLAKLEGMIASIAAAVTAPKKAEDKKDEKKEEVKAADEKKDEKPAEVKADDKKDEKKEEVKAADEKKDEKPAEVKADDEEKTEEKEASVVKAGPNEMDIELTGSMDDALPPDPVADAQLASLFDGGLTAAEGEEKDDAEKTAKSKKAGIKKLGGQPKVAAQSTAQVDIGSIWQSAPDVSEVFK